MSQRKTHKDFLKILEVRNAKAFKEISFLDEYISTHTPILAIYNGCKIKITPARLYSGSMPDIRSAVNPHEYFLNQLKDVNPKAFKELKFLETYSNRSKALKVKDKYGEVRISPGNLLAGKMPSIRTALNKKEYFINKAKEIHGDRYDYSETFYTNYSAEVLIKCKECGRDFYQNPFSHLAGRGCLECAQSQGGWTKTKWVNRKKGKNFDGYKLYVLKLYDDSEEFIKIGITSVTIKTRYSRGKEMSYSYDILFSVESEDGSYIWDLEKELHRKHKKKRYLPKNFFEGWTECYSMTVLKDLELAKQWRN